MAPVIASEDTAYVSSTAAVDEVSCRALLKEVTQLVAAGKKEIHLLIATGGGSVMCGFTLYNTLRGLPVKLVTHNVGNIDSIGNVVFLAADERYASTYATFMFHGVGWGTPDASVTGPQAREIVTNIDADEQRISRAIAQHTKLTTAAVEKYFQQAATLNARAALKHGIVSAVRDVSIPQGVQTIVIG